MRNILRLVIFIQCFFLIVKSFNGFVPKVEWKCSNTSVSIKVLNNSPFFGIIHPTGQRKRQECTVLGSGSTVLDFEIDFQRCDVHYDKNSQKYRLNLELHEHRMLLRDQDQVVDIECHSKALLIASNLPKSEEVEPSIGSDNMTESMESLLEAQPEIKVDLEMMADNSTSTKVTKFGTPYNLKVSINHEFERRFRVHSCFATSDDQNVELISSNGCSVDKSLIENFVYQEKSASAKIPSMFRFIDSSKSVVFHCKVWLCDENEECKPNCVLKLDDPVGEDPEVVSKLLRSTDSEEITGASGSAPIPNQKNVASSLVHVLDQREVPTTMIPPTEFIPATDRTVNITGCRCDFPENLVILYKLCIALSILFSLGCCCNVMFCCLNVRGKNATKKRRSVPKTIAQSTLTKNQYWINEPNRATFEEFPTSQYTEMQPTTHNVPDLTTQPARTSLTSYASLRPRPKVSIDHPVSLVGHHHANGQQSGNTSNDNNNNAGFYDTNATSIISALSNYNNNRNSPPRSSGYEVPNNRTFHSASNSVSTASPRNSVDHGINPATHQLISSTTSANQNDSPQFLTLQITDQPQQQKETYSIL